MQVFATVLPLGNATCGRYNNDKAMKEIVMPSLAQTNPYLRDPILRRQLIRENVYASSVMEGARGLPKPPRYSKSPKRRVIASSKKRPKAA